MVATQIHLVRHGEVHNPEGILYGRMPGYHLSELGRRMASAAAAVAKKQGWPVTRLIASPLERAQESAQPWAAAFGLKIETDDRLIEPENRFEGQRFEFGPQVLTRPASWPWVLNPFRPSWGESYASIADRMLSAIEDAWQQTDDGRVVLVSHQLPICMVQRFLVGKHLYHDPRRRRCSLSSITTLAVRDAPESGQRSLRSEPASVSKGTSRDTASSLRDGSGGPPFETVAERPPQRKPQGPGGRPHRATGSRGAGQRFVEVDYQDPAAELLAQAVDMGAV